jgi:hypothetical protein
MDRAMKPRAATVVLPRNQGFLMSMLRRVLAFVLLGLLAGSFAHAGGADLTHSAFPETSLGQSADAGSGNVKAAGTDCFVVCPGTGCIVSSPAVLHLEVVLARPLMFLGAQVARGLRAPDTAPPKAAFA